MRETRPRSGVAKDRRIRRRWAALVPLALVLYAPYLYWAQVEHRLLTVVDGEVYRSAAMPPERLLRVAREHGIRTVVDLRRVGEESSVERAALATAGIRHVQIPSGIVPEARTVRAFLETVADPQNRPLLFHCKHGIGRSTTFEAIYRIELEGWSRERARQSAYWRSGLGSFESDSRRGRFLLGYARMLGRDETPPSEAGAP